MLLRFPSLEAFTLSLTSGLVPPEVSAQSVRAAIDNEGAVFVSPSPGFSASLLQQLRPPGVTLSDRTAVPLVTFDHWLQVVPLVRRAGELQATDKTVVLFDLDNSEQLSEVVSEILRLGNDRQSFRQLAAEGQ